MKFLRRATVSVVLLFLPLVALAYEFDPGGIIAKTTGLPTKSPKEIAIAYIQISLGFLALITVLLIIIGGTNWMLAGGNEEKILKAKSLLRNAIIGLAIVLASWVLVRGIFIWLGGILE